MPTFNDAFLKNHRQNVASLVGGKTSLFVFFPVVRPHLFSMITSYGAEEKKNKGLADAHELG